MENIENLYQLRKQWLDEGSVIRYIKGKLHWRGACQGCFYYLDEGRSRARPRLDMARLDEDKITRQWQGSELEKDENLHQLGVSIKTG